MRGFELQAGIESEIVFRSKKFYSDPVALQQSVWE